MKNIESEKLIFNNIVVTGPPRLDTVKEYINWGRPNNKKSISSFYVYKR